MPNLLNSEESPYLREHKDDLINWYPWSKEAFEKAEKEDKLIFLSIGYSSCHWCHIMQQESFKNPEIAKKLNEHFISIKVDKEERPDIDRHFQQVFMKMTKKSGGWPLSIFMTYNKVPLYSGAYIPPTPKYGLIGLSELLDILVLKYKSDKETLLKEGIAVLDALKPKGKIEATKIHEGLIDIVIKQIKSTYDKENGGFGKAPKFPRASVLDLTLNLYKFKRDRELKEIVVRTFDNMLKGGLYDIVDGGFCRYSVDSKWLIPHFEKMTYDNALLANTLITAYREFKRDIYKDVAIKTIDFIFERLHKDGLFFSATDADSNGVEGAYFVYDFEEVKTKFKERDLPLELLEELNIKEDGDFNSLSIARVRDIERLRDRDIQEALTILREIRKNREHPKVDEKILTSWNSMVIITLFNASKIDSKYLKLAKESLSKLEEKMLRGDRLYHSALLTTTPKIEGFLEDYAWFIKALLTAYSVTLDKLYIFKAKDLMDKAIMRFYMSGFWRVGGDEFNDFDSIYDSSMPSSVGLMVDNLLTLRSLIGEEIYAKVAFSTIEVNSYELMRRPITFAKMTDSTIRYIKDDTIIKSKRENLKELVNFNFKYPYIVFKITDNNKIELCTNSRCFATFNSIKELKREL